MARSLVASLRFISACSRARELREERSHIGIEPARVEAAPWLAWVDERPE